MAKKKAKNASPFVPVEEQPYQLPENWCWVVIGKITEIIGGGTPPSSVNEYYDGGTIPWITPADLSDYNEVYISKGRKMITEAGLEKSSAKMLPTGTVCLSSRAPIGYVAIAQNPLSTNQGFKSFLPSKCYIPQYLYWYLKGNKELLESKASGTTFPELSGKKASQLPFPVAPLQEQQRIVDRIESLFAKLDEAKEKAQEALDSFDLRKAAILHQAFSGELTSEWRSAHDASLCDWKQMKLKNCGNWFGGGTPTTSRPEYWENGNILWITSKDMKSDEIVDTQLHITQAGVNNSSAIYCEDPAVLFVMRSGILKRTLPVCMTSVPFTVNQDLKAVIPNESLTQRYLFWVCTGFEKDIRNKCMKSGTTVESIETKKFFDYSIPVAPVKEQMEIVRILDNFFAKEAEAKEKVEATLEAIETMKKAILAKAFRGELSTNNPADESAEELLKRTLA